MKGDSWTYHYVVFNHFNHITSNVTVDLSRQSAFYVDVYILAGIGIAIGTWFYLWRSSANSSEGRERNTQDSGGNVSSNSGSSNDSTTTSSTPNHDDPGDQEGEAERTTPRRVVTGPDPTNRTSPTTSSGSSRDQDSQNAGNEAKDKQRGNQSTGSNVHITGGTFVQSVNGGSGTTTYDNQGADIHAGETVNLGGRTSEHL